MEIPQEFKERVRCQLGDSYDDFMAEYGKERVCGLRYNPLKIEKERLVRVLDSYQVALEPVDWAEEGFYYAQDTQPGKLPLHEAGAYYIQEPSAMIAVSLLDPRPGDKVLDLCAAPGGKSTQIAGRLHGDGLLVSNEIMPERAKILSRNIERMGIANAVVLNETPERLARRCPAFFDRILADAPCSGEGMFRKDINAREEWSPGQVEVCAQRQREILSCAAQMLKPGGVLVYSTCTFAPMENEKMAEWFVEQYPQFSLEGSEQIWPHRQRGEGHFAARFGREGAGACSSGPDSRKERIKAAGSSKKTGHGGGGQGSRKDFLQSVSKFLTETLSQEMAQLIAGEIDMGRLAVFGDQLYIKPEGIGRLDGLKVLRPGLQLGCCRKNRFEPSHALAMALRPEDAKQVLELDEPYRYLRGETVSCSLQNGWTLVTADGCSLGWGKAVQGVLKNHYPKGLRRGGSGF